MFYNHMGEIIQISEKVSSCYKRFSINKQDLFLKRNFESKSCVQKCYFKNWH
jgi:hypothetical protein